MERGPWINWLRLLWFGATGFREADGRPRVDVGIVPDCPSRAWIWLPRSRWTRQIAKVGDFVECVTRRFRRTSR
jgi:hypothetical protein